MRLLVLGGTAWLGHRIATTALEGGHEVTCLARGTGIPDGATHVRADRDEPGALDSVAREHWDAVVDVARQPGHLRRAVAALEPVTDRYLFVSSCSVYASQARIGADEREPTFEPLEADVMASPEDYGPAKVACERAVLAAFGPDRSLIARAGLIGGPGDPSGRTTYWPWRFAHPSSADGAVLAPDAATLPVAAVDVRDLAAWLVEAAASIATSGVMNVMGRPMLLPDHLELVRSLAGHRGEVVRAPEAWLAQQGVAEWAGPRSLPLWLADPDWYGMNARSIDRALAAGLVLRPLEQTVRDILSVQTAPPTGAGLTDDEERELLAERGRIPR
ncbi:MAG: NAD-dependent epimerase/dehydratase family protein [Pseudolysinimonas sp.]